jgi:DNA-binding PadR family transcriptional regulator
MSDKYLGPLEQMVLMALVRLDGTHGYGYAITQEIERRTGRVASLPATYITLDRLEKKGLVSSCVGSAEVDRRGRAKRFFRIEEAGRLALEETLRAFDGMRVGLRWEVSK